MHLHDRAVQGNRFHANPDDVLALKRLEDPIQHAVLGPPAHSGIDRVPGTISPRQSPPFAAMLGNVKDRVEHAQIVVPYVAPLHWKVTPNPVELLSRDFHILIIPQFEPIVLTRPRKNISRMCRCGMVGS